MNQSVQRPRARNRQVSPALTLTTGTPASSPDGIAIPFAASRAAMARPPGPRRRAARLRRILSQVGAEARALSRSAFVRTCAAGPDRRAPRLTAAADTERRTLLRPDGAAAGWATSRAPVGYPEAVEAMKARARDIAEG